MGPTRHPALDQGEDDVECDAEHRQDQKPGENQRHVEARARYHHQVADAAVGRDRFGNDGAHERLGHRHFQRREEIRHGARQSDIGENVELAGLERPHHVFELRLGGGQSRRNVHHDGKDAQDHRGQHRRDGAGAEPENENRNHRDLRNTRETNEQRIRHVIGELR